MRHTADSEPIIVVAGHVCLDLIPQDLPAPLDLRPNTLTRIGPAVVATGGCVANVGIALHRLGMRTRLVGRVGDDALGRLLMDEIRRRGGGSDATAGFTVAAGDPTSYSIVVSPGGADRLFWHCPGANDHFAGDDVGDDTLTGAAWLHFGYPPIMRRIAMDGGAAAAGIFERARRLGLRTSLDFCSVDPRSEAGQVDWRQWMARVLPHVDLAAPSFDETAAMLGLEASPTPDNIRACAEALLAMGAGAVALKLGEAGLYYRDRDGTERQEGCFRVEVAGTTGAGDCTIAGLIASLAGGDDIATAMTTAVAVGACCCEQPDATSGIVPLEAVRQRLATGWPRR